MAKNRVVAGDYQGKVVDSSFGNAYIITGFLKTVNLDKSTVESYDVMTEDKAKSAFSVGVRGLVGGALLGPVGLLAGALSAKNKGVILLSVKFKDGKQSLLEIDDKIHRVILSKCF